MERKLSIDSRYSESQCKPYDYFIDVYLKKVVGIFNDIEKESNEAANHHFQFLGEHLSPEYADLDYLMDASFNKGLEYFEMVSLVKYNVKLMWFSTMYQFWEQQVRVYLYKEGGYRLNSNSEEVAFKNYCTTIGAIKKEFLKYRYDIEQMDCWEELDELRLLANVIKHGDGGAATHLKEKRPDFFYNEILEENTFDHYGTSLNEKTLKINGKQLMVYKEALQSFWKELYQLLKPTQYEVKNFFAEINFE